MECGVNTCRFCRQWERNGKDNLLKYGVRHYAHYECYLNAGKQLEDLHAWQVGHFPFRLLEEKKLLLRANAIMVENEKRREA